MKKNNTNTIKVGKKTYTKKQIQESIKHWQKVLEGMDRQSQSEFAVVYIDNEVPEQSFVNFFKDKYTIETWFVGKSDIYGWLKEFDKNLLTDLRNNGWCEWNESGYSGDANDYSGEIFFCQLTNEQARKIKLSCKHTDAGSSLINGYLIPEDTVDQTINTILEIVNECKKSNQLITGLAI